MIIFTSDQEPVTSACPSCGRDGGTSEVCPLRANLTRRVKVRALGIVSIVVAVVGMAVLLFFDAGAPMIPYVTYTHNISFSPANTGDEALLLGPADQLVDGVAWGTRSLPGNVFCVAIDPNQYPLGNPFISRSPLWKDTDNCLNDFVIDTSGSP